MIWKHHPTPDAINQWNQNTMVTHLGIDITEIGPDYIRSRMPVDHRTRQPYGMLHGGASVVLSESIGSMATALTLEDFIKWSVVGVEISASHLKSAHNGYVYGYTRPIKLGKTLQVWETEITDESGNKICHSKLTTMILPVKS